MERSVRVLVTIYVNVNLNHQASLSYVRRFYPRDATIIAQALAVVVCLPVCLPQVGVLLKRLDVGSRKQRHTIAQESSFLLPKISGKLKRGYPQRMRQMRVGIGYMQVR